MFGSSKDVHCTFNGNASHPSEHYEGTINKFGVDIGYTGGGVLVWGVFAPSSDIRPGALQGDYAGATAIASVMLVSSFMVLLAINLLQSRSAQQRSAQ